MACPKLPRLPTTRQELSGVLRLRAGCRLAVGQLGLAAVMGLRLLRARRLATSTAEPAEGFRVYPGQGGKEDERDTDADANANAYLLGVGEP